MHDNHELGLTRWRFVPAGDSRQPFRRSSPRRTQRRAGGAIRTGGFGMSLCVHQTSHDLAALVADFLYLGVSRGAIDDGVVLEWGRCLRCEQRAYLKASIAGRCLDHEVPDHVFSDTQPSVQRGSRRAA